jgi:branched-chain amino acid transport system ATP-binding protein
MSWLEIRDLEAFYHRIRVLHGVSLQLEVGDFASVIGSNGAGKTTLLRAISRLVSVKGLISFDGEDLTSLRPQRVIKKGIIHCPEGRLLFPNMSVLQNLKMGAFMRKGEEEIEEDLQRVFHFLPVLAARTDQLAGTLSGGEQQMLAVGRAVMARPRLLTLDEPSFGLAPLVVDAIFEVILRLNQEGLSILLVEQNAALALEVSNYAYVLEEGHIVNQGESQTLSQDADIARAYLGMA